MRRGIFIGINGYDDPDIANLRFAKCDADVVAETLFQSCGFDRNFSAVLTTQEIAVAGDKQEPDSENIHLAFERQRQLGPCEAFTLYFSGHGFRGKNGIDYLVPRRARLDALEATSIPLSRLLAACLEIEAKTILVIIDACRTNFVGRSVFGALADDATIALRGCNLVLFYSAQPGQLSYESSKLQAGMFSAVFSRLMSSAYQCKSLGQIYEALRRELPNACLAAGKPTQQPYVTFLPDKSRDWVLAISKLTQRFAMPEWLGEEIRNHHLSTENISPDPHFALALDFGTTKTIGAFWQGDKLSYVKNHGGGRVKYSTIEFEQSGNYRVGQPPYGRNLVAYAKRRIMDRQAYLCGEHVLSPMQAASLIIDSLVQDFEVQTGSRRADCVAAVPCDYSIVDAGLLVQALQGNGLRVTQVIREPTAAAFNLLELLRPEEVGTRELTAVVLDMGGGTLDVSIVCVSVTSYQGSTQLTLRVLASCGNRRLGGIDFNAKLHGHILHKSGLAPVTDRLVDPHSLAVDIEAAKLALSRASDPTVSVELLDDTGEQISVPIRITQHEFSQVSADLVKDAMKCVENCVERAVIWGHEHCDGVKLDADGTSRLEPDVVLIAGQSGQIPAIRKRISARFPQASIIDKYSENAVARGLAIASRLDCEIIDVAYFSIGIIGLIDGNQIVLPRPRQSQVQASAQAPILPHTQANTNPVWLIYAEDEVPTRGMKGLFVGKGGLASITIVSATVAGRIEAIATIEVDLDRYRGNIAQIALVIDKAMTLVVEITDDRRQVEARQINNFYRLPDGYAASGSITLANHEDEFSGGREVIRATATR